MLEKEPKQGKKFQYLCIYNLEKIWSRIHQVFGPEFTWSRIHLVPNSPLGPEFTWSRIHLVPNSPDTPLPGYFLVAYPPSFFATHTPLLYFVTTHTPSPFFCLPILPPPTSPTGQPI